MGSADRLFQFLVIRREAKQQERDKNIAYPTGMNFPGSENYISCILVRTAAVTSPIANQRIVRNGSKLSDSHCTTNWMLVEGEQDLVLFVFKEIKQFQECFTASTAANSKTAKCFLDQQDMELLVSGNHRSRR